MASSSSSSSSSSLSSVNSNDPAPQLLQLFPTTPSPKPVFDWDLNEDPPVDVNDEIPPPGIDLSLEIRVAAVEEEAASGAEEN